MRVRILLSVCMALLLSVGVATAAASTGHARTAAAKNKWSASKQMCEGFGGAFSTRESSSFFRPFFKKQGVLWTCNSYSGGSTSSQQLVQSCLSNDGGKATSTSDAGFATCWQNAPL